MPTMTISVSEEMKKFVSTIIKNGTYSNASEVFRDGIRSIQEKQLKLQALRQHMKKAIAEEGRYTDDEVETFLMEEATKEV